MGGAFGINGSRFDPSGGGGGNAARPTGAAFGGWNAGDGVPYGED